MKFAIVPLLVLGMMLCASAMPVRSTPRAYKMPSSVVPFLAKDKCEICESHLSNAVHGGIDMIWMTTFMLEICPALLHLVCPGCSPDMSAPCDAAADWLLIDIDNHLVPDGIFYCEKMGLCPDSPNPTGVAAFNDVKIVQDKPPSFLVNVYVNYTVDAALSPGQIVLRLPNPLPSANAAQDYYMPVYFDALAPGTYLQHWKFDATGSSLFPGACREAGDCGGVMPMRIGLCELECPVSDAEPNPHPGAAKLGWDVHETYILSDN